LEVLEEKHTFARVKQIYLTNNIHTTTKKDNMKLFNANAAAKCLAFAALLSFGLNAAAQDVKQADKKETCCKKDNKKCCKKEDKKDNKKCCKKEDKKSCKKGCMNDCKKECNEKKGCCGEQGCGDKKSCDKK
jgi:hypothetical protein bfra3_18539